ncbi:MAG: hypothetical protein U0842_17965, partial [Candidatus Binatia bacterium]
MVATTDTPSASTRPNARFSGTFGRLGCSGTSARSIDAHVRRRELRVDRGFHRLLDQRAVEVLRALDVVLQQLVARAQVAQQDRRLLEVRELGAQALLSRAGRVETGLDARGLLRDLALQLARDLALLLAQLDHLGMVRAELRIERRALRAQIEQREVQLLDARLVEEVRHRVVALHDGLVLGLQPDPVGLGRADLRGQLVHLLTGELLLLIDRDVGVVGRERLERALGLLDAAARLLELLAEELLRGDVVGQSRLGVGLHVGLRVRAGEHRRQLGARRGEAHLDEVGAAHVAHVEVAHVAVEQLGRDLGAAAGVVVRGLVDDRAAAEAARTQERQQASADRQQPRPGLGRVEEGLVAREIVRADDALGEVAALQRRDLRREKARR